MRSVRGLFLLVRGTIVKAWGDRVLGLAAEAGFWALVSLPPLLLAVLGTVGYAAGLANPGNIEALQTSILRAASRVLTPSAVQGIVEPTVRQVLHGGRADIVSVGFLISLWSGSTAMATYVNTITIAYDLRDHRSAVRSRLLAFGLFLVAVVVGVVLVPALVLGPRVIIRIAPLALRAEVVTVLHAAYWPFVVGVSVALIASLYHLSVPVRTPWHRDLPGAVLAMGLWLAGSVGLRFYFAVALRHNSTYAAVAAPMAVLLWLYITALAVLFGAELNAQIDKLWPVRSTDQARAESAAHHRERPAA
jgi:membrane protein